jgi:hypothetical protein
MENTPQGKPLNSFQCLTTFGKPIAQSMISSLNGAATLSPGELTNMTSIKNYSWFSC